MTMTEHPHSASRNPHRASLEFIRPAQTGITHGYLVETALSPTRGGLPLSANLAQALTLEAHRPRRIHARSHAIDNGYTPKRCFNTLYTALHHDAALPINPPRLSNGFALRTQILPDPLPLWSRRSTAASACVKRRIWDITIIAVSFFGHL